MSVTSPSTLIAERGSVEESASKEILQEGALHALAASAGCTLSNPKPDVNGIDWTITLHSRNHSLVWDAKVDVQLKCTHQSSPNTRGDFPFKLRNDRFVKLAHTQISNPRLLLVMLCPSDIEKWVYTSPSITALRHSMYWCNLYGLQPSGQEETVVRIPYTQRLDALELCRILHIIGNTGKPWTL
ncbi:DUF4365 domain-containing protein [Mycolicibacterium sp. XJ1904]